MGRGHPRQYDLSTLRVLGTVGEAINPEAWRWFHRVIGGGKCPIVDTWWQTETGAIMVSQLPGITAAKPGSAQQPIPGITIDVVDDLGESLPNGQSGFLTIREPWPSMLRTIWGDDDRFVDTYWSRFENMYFAGDGAKRDADGDLWVLGRVDDVMNVSGHRLSTPKSNRPWSPTPPSQRQRLSVQPTKPPARPSWPSSSSTTKPRQQGTTRPSWQSRFVLTWASKSPRLPSPSAC